MSAELARRALEVVSERGADPALTVQAARRLMGAGELAEGEAHLLRVRALMAAAGDDAGLANVLGQLSIVAMARNDFNECLALNQRAFELVRHGQESGAWTYEAGIAIVLSHMGELDAAQGCVDRLVALGSPIVAEIAQMPSGVVDIERGQLDRVAARLDRLAAVTLLEIDEFTAAVLLLKARWLFDSGDAAGALAALADAAAVAGELFETSLIERLYWQARAAAVLGDDATIVAAREALDEQVAIGVGPGAGAAVAWIGGFIDARAGRHPDAARQFTEAATTWERLGRHTCSAEVWLDAAVSFDACGAAERDARADALARLDEIAAPRGLARILARRDAMLGAPKSAHRRGPGELTDREREIAELVALGRTNREIGEALFLSEHTVRNHLVRIFDKLGVSRRAELAGLVAGPDWTKG